MKINNISNANFKGLWGKTTINSGKIGKRINHYYYPFKNESQKTINEYVDTYSNSYTYSENGHICFYSEDVAVQPPLDFTKQEFLTYKKVQKTIDRMNLSEHFRC